MQASDSDPTQQHQSSRFSIPRYSLGREVIKYVFCFYLLVAIIVTLIQMYIEFNRVQASLVQEMKVVAQTITPGLSEQLWNFDDEGVGNALKRIILNHKIMGIIIFDKKGRQVCYAGEVDAPGQERRTGLMRELIGIDFEINYLDEDDGTLNPVGKGTVFTGPRVAFDQVKYGFILIIINSAIKTAALWLITVFFITRFIERPLGDLEQVTRNFDLTLPPRNSEDETKFNQMRVRKDQMGWLFSAYEEMQSKIRQDYRVIQQQNQQIQSDMLELRRTEEALRESELQKRDLLNNATSIIYIKDCDGHYTFVNRRFERLFHVSGQDLKNKTANDIFPSEIADRLRANDLKVLKAGGAIEFEETVPLEGGDYKFLSVKFPLKSPSGENYAICGISTDITKRKKAEENLRISNERFVTILNSIDASVYVSDMDTCEILFMNPYMIELFGRDMTGEICWKAFGDGTGRCAHCKNDQLINNDGKPACPVISQDTKPFRGRYFIRHDRAIKWTDGRLVHIQIATDITNLKTMEEQLLQAQKMESVGRLAGGVAHDFNNMLTVILGNTEIILEDIPHDTPFRENLNEIFRAADRSRKLTHQLLAFARKQTIEPKVLNLNREISEMLRMLRRLIGEDIDLAWMPGSDLWKVKLDPVQMDQILANLCVNARDAIEGVGKVTIETGNTRFDEAYCRDHEDFVSGDYVMLSVSDSGCGMDEETVQKIFEPFFSTKGMGEGTGLGLSTVYGIVRQNSGFIHVYSEPDKGTTFRIYLSRFLETVTQEEEKRQKSGDKTGDETILIVEDEEAILNMTAMMLKRLGYTVLPANTPSEAVQVMTSYSGKIHLMVTDVIMPEMNGRMLSEKLLRISPDLKCLFMSGYTANVIAHHGVLNEGTNFISKPFSKQALAAKVREILDRKADDN